VARSYPPEDRKRILDRLDAGHSITAIAHDVGISGQTLYNWRNQHLSVGPGRLARPGDLPQPRWALRPHEGCQAHHRRRDHRPTGGRRVSSEQVSPRRPSPPGSTTSNSPTRSAVSRRSFLCSVSEYADAE